MPSWTNTVRVLADEPGDSHRPPVGGETGDVHTDGFRGGLTGKLLVASPHMLGPTFERTVILVLDHQDDGGSLGVVLNRPTAAAVESILPRWQQQATPPGTVFDGGPVGRDSALAVALVPGDSPEPPGVRRISGALGLVDLDGDPQSLVGHVSALRVFVGYAGWGAGQLRGELEDNSWFVVEAEAWDAFSSRPAALWVDVLARQPGDLALVARYPSDPELN